MEHPGRSRPGLPLVLVDAAKLSRWLAELAGLTTAAVPTGTGTHLSLVLQPLTRSWGGNVDEDVA